MPARALTPGRASRARFAKPAHATRSQQGLADLRRIALGTGLLVFNSVVLDPPGSPAVLYTLHTLPQAIGEVPVDAHAGKLLLSHLSPVIGKAQQAVEASIAHRCKGPRVAVYECLA